MSQGKKLRRKAAAAWKESRRQAKRKDTRTTTHEHLSNLSASETIKHRDVYKGQQVHRSTIGNIKGFKGLQVAAGVMFGVGALTGWSCMAGGELVWDKASEQLSSITNSQPDFTYVSEEFVMPDMVYFQVDAQGNKTDGVAYASAEEVPVPDWYIQAVAQWEARRQAEADARFQTYGEAFFKPDMFKSFGAVGGGVALASIPAMMMKRRKKDNVMEDVTDINQHEGDQHIQEPEELFERYDFAPDVGAHFDRAVSSVISHVFLESKKVKKVTMAKRHSKDLVIDGEVVAHKGEMIFGDDGRPVVEQVPLLDKEFGQALYETSGVPDEYSVIKGKKMPLRKFFDPAQISYNPGGSNRDRLKYDTLLDVINETWLLPGYEPQRPAGAYIIDTAPVNTMVLAITRAGKGQTYIEPTLDLWMREKVQHNAVVNDPKGELLVKNYVRATMRGYQVVQFNLINPMKTDIYNPLGMAAEAAREGDSVKCSMYIGNIADVFFPLDGGEDPVWPNAANNAFKRAAYGLIDFYLEEERALRQLARQTGMPVGVLEGKLDELWGRVTLYNCYQLFTYMASKKKKSPVAELDAQRKSGAISEEQYQEDVEQAQIKTDLIWDGKPEADMLTLFGNATVALPKNSMRTLYINADNALRSMAGAEKMLASVYGIAITAMSFFSDPTIMTMTSGRPSQNTDLAALGFPRRIGVRFNANFVKDRNYVGAQCRWQSFADDQFTQSLGKDFYHEDIVSREGWARYYFEGIFPEKVGYVRLELVNPVTGLVLNTYYFKFTKTYVRSLDGRFYITDPVLDERIVKNGLLVEMVWNGEKFVEGQSTFRRQMLTQNEQTRAYEVGEGRDYVVISNHARYTETPKMIFLVTPPHLMSYAKLILILIKQLVDLNFDKSYMTKPDQKPLRKTRFMLDELGNLQSEGKGIAGLETMLSIGLGQEQQFTLILQTLQQLRDVYGESSDKIIQGNAQPLDSKIATPTGYIQMKDVVLGDTVLTPGGTSQVIGVYPQGEREVYEVTGADGRSARACDEHLWEVVIEDESQVPEHLKHLLTRA